MNYSDPPGGKVGEVASRAVANPKLQLEQDLGHLKEILEGRASPEEIQQRSAAAPTEHQDQQHARPQDQQARPGGEERHQHALDRRRRRALLDLLGAGPPLEDLLEVP